jgi:hypothetical protein
MNPIHTLQIYLPEIQFNVASHTRPGLLKGLFTSGFPTRTLHVHFIFPIPATCPAVFILLDLIILITLAQSTNYELLIRHHPPPSCHCIPLRSNYDSNAYLLCQDVTSEGPLLWRMPEDARKNITMKEVKNRNRSMKGRNIKEIKSESRKKEEGRCFAMI